MDTSTESYEEKTGAEAPAKAHENPRAGPTTCAEEALSTDPPGEGLKPIGEFLAEAVRLLGVNALEMSLSEMSLFKFGDARVLERPQLAGSDRHDLGGSRAGLTNAGSFARCCHLSVPSDKENRCNPTDSNPGVGNA
jgi:hypothetical protein